MSRCAIATAILAALACTGAPAPSAPPPAPPKEGTASTAWWNGAVFYEVFVRSFRDSDGDGHGDLAGLLEKLDYLNDGDPSTTSDLGVDALWLMPVFASPSYHGYDVTDYEAIDPDYGSTADLDRLVAAAHARGMKVIVDFVLNHTSVAHPWFVEASDPASPRRDWYVWSATDPGWRPPWDPGAGPPTWHAGGGGYYYGLFWGGMPDLNWREPAVQAELQRIATGWLARGIDGFRLDAIRYLVEDGGGVLQQDRPGTHAALKGFADAVRAASPDAALVGEAWADATVIARYYGSTTALPGGDELPLLFDFPVAQAILDGVGAGDARGLASALALQRSASPRGAASAPFLTNHDQRRVGTQLGADPARLKLAAAILLTLPGAPFIYYGEELGAQNGPGGGDEEKRAPMAWDGTGLGGFTSGAPWWPFAPGQAGANVAAQSGDPGSVLSRYRELIRARHASLALRRGELSLLPSGSNAVLAYTLRAGDETVVVAHNLSAAQATTALLDVPGAVAEPVWTSGATMVGAGGRWTASLPARSSGVWRIR